MKNIPKYENMTEFQFLEMVNASVFEVLRQSLGTGIPIENVPKITVGQLRNISFENSFNEHRIIFNPEENRQVVLKITAEEIQYDDE